MYVCACVCMRVCESVHMCVCLSVCLCCEAGMSNLGDSIQRNPEEKYPLSLA